MISGTFNMGVGDKLDMQKSMSLRPGSMMIQLYGIVLRGRP